MFLEKGKTPRILIVTPEITYLPEGMGNMYHKLRAKAGGLADVSASLVGALYRQGADVHVALPHYRRMFHIEVGNLISDELRVYTQQLSNSRIHLAEDRIFYYRNAVYSNYSQDSFLTAMAFQREVINNIIPAVMPDLIHCNDWMTGLIPAFARRIGIPCLFTVHNIHTYKATMAEIEDRGIDAAEFWNNFYFERPPYNYEESRDNNKVDLMASGIFASHFINTVSPTFLKEVVENRHDFVPPQIQSEVASKFYAGCAAGILNAPDEANRPETDPLLPLQYNSTTHRAGKRECKLLFQQRTGLKINPDAPILFWPSRLDPMQKGCSLLTDILYRVLEEHRKLGMQLAIVANGSYQKVFRDIVAFHDLFDRVTVCDFDESLSHLGFAASDFVLMPSKFEPCGLPQMECQYYGSLPIVMDTGGLHDTVEPLSKNGEKGNGFRFENYDSGGLFWAIGEAMKFYAKDGFFKEQVISRVMNEAHARFTHENTAGAYMDLYEKMLQRPLIKRKVK